jgi:hypothetical protein
LHDGGPIEIVHDGLTSEVLEVLVKAVDFCGRISRMRDLSAALTVDSQAEVAAGGGKWTQKIR